MTEFMTQRELAEEFLLFLGQDKDVKKQFLDDIKYGYPQATPYNVGGKKLATFASVGDDPIKYIMEMSKKDKIINLCLPLDYSMQPIPTSNTQVTCYRFCIKKKQKIQERDCKASIYWAQGADKILEGRTYGTIQAQ